MNISEALATATRTLSNAGVDDPARQAASLLRAALNKPQSFLIAHPEYQLTAEERNKFANFVSRRASREPLQYITGRQEFWGLEFDLVPGVLIPRPETEILVEAAVKSLESIEKPIFCEAGVGSGCISVSILHTLKEARAVATDLSHVALDLSQRNAQKHDVADRLELYHSDLLTGVGGGFDAIVSNPPYVSSVDIPTLQAEVRDFEPHTALDGGPDGLDIVRRLIDQAQTRLRAGGALFVEIGIGQHHTVSRLFNEHVWADPIFLNDLQNIPRVVSVSRR